MSITNLFFTLVKTLNIRFSHKVDPLVKDKILYGDFAEDITHILYFTLLINETENQKV